MHRSPMPLAATLPRRLTQGPPLLLRHHYGCTCRSMLHLGPFRDVPRRHRRRRRLPPTGKRRRECARRRPTQLPDRDFGPQTVRGRPDDDRGVAYIGSGGSHDDIATALAGTPLAYVLASAVRMPGAGDLQRHQRDTRRRRARPSSGEPCRRSIWMRDSRRKMEMGEKAAEFSRAHLDESPGLPGGALECGGVGGRREGGSRRAAERTAGQFMRTRPPSGSCGDHDARGAPGPHRAGGDARRAARRRRSR